jgi:hypothetical protein
MQEMCLKALNARGGNEKPIDCLKSKKNEKKEHLKSKKMMIKARLCHIVELLKKNEK